jgi:signal transduction histidine kinase
MYAMKVNADHTGWARRYHVALRHYLRDGPSASLKPAFRLGASAVALGLETLDLALLHEQSLVRLALPGGDSKSRRQAVERANRFFIETIVPIEKTHPTARKDDALVAQLAQVLARRTEEVRASGRLLARNASERQAVEVKLRKSGKHHAKLAQESSRLKRQVRGQTGVLFLAQEDERKKNSRRLHDEVVQVLLAINLRLLALRTKAKVNMETLEKEIAGTQRLVRESIATINRFAYESAVQYKAK